MNNGNNSNNSNNNQEKIADKAEVVFVAGVFEAVGKSIIFKSSNWQFGCVIIISQRDPQLLRKLCKEFGGVLKYVDKAVNKLPTFTWEIRNNEAKELAEQILPYIVNLYKREKLSGMIKFANSQDNAERLNMVEAARIIDEQHRERLSEEAVNYKPNPNPKRWRSDS